MHPNRLFIWLALFMGLLLLGRSLELDPDELRDHYAQEQVSTVCANPVRILLPAPVWQALVPVTVAENWSRNTPANPWVDSPRPVFYDDPPPRPRRFLRLRVLRL